MTVAYTFASRTSSIPLSELDANFATATTLGNVSFQLGNVVTTVGNLTLTNVTISSGTATLGNVTLGNVSYSGLLTGGTANLVTSATNTRVLRLTATAGYVSNLSLTRAGYAEWLLGSTNNSAELKLSLNDETHSAPVMMFDSARNVGFNVPSSPSTNLDVYFNGGMARFGGASGNNLLQAYTGSVGGGVWAGGITRFYATGAMTFSVNSTLTSGIPTGYTDAIVIDSSGNFLVGTAGNSNNYKAHIVTTGSGAAIGVFQNNATTPYGMNIYYGAAAPNNSNANTSFLYCNDTSTLRIQLASNGGVINYQANNSNLSDRREKKDFAPAKSYLNTICSIPVQTFKYIDQTDDAPTLGVVAQDVQAVAPELVTESDWGTPEKPKKRLSIYQTDLQYALMKALQELKEQNDKLAARVKVLETK